MKQKNKNKRMEYFEFDSIEAMNSVELTTENVGEVARVVNVGYYFVSVDLTWAWFGPRPPRTHKPQK